LQSIRTALEIFWIRGLLVSAAMTRIGS